MLNMIKAVNERFLRERLICHPHARIPRLVSVKKAVAIRKLPARAVVNRKTRREETNASILAMAADGGSIKEIRPKTGYSRKLIRAVLCGQRWDIFRTRQSSLEPWLPWLDEQCGGSAERLRTLARPQAERLSRS
jgi:hypothetical protein